jgi:hypothetical protein
MAGDSNDALGRGWATTRVWARDLPRKDVNTFDLTYTVWYLIQGWRCVCVLRFATEFFPARVRLGGSLANIVRRAIFALSELLHTRTILVVTHHYKEISDAVDWRCLQGNRSRLSFLSASLEEERP